MSFQPLFLMAIFFSFCNYWLETLLVITCSLCMSQKSVVHRLLLVESQHWAQREQCYNVETDPLAQVIQAEHASHLSQSNFLPLDTYPSKPFLFTYLPKCPLNVIILASTALIDSTLHVYTTLHVEKVAPQIPLILFPLILKLCLLILMPLPKKKDCVDLPSVSHMVIYTSKVTHPS